MTAPKWKGPPDVVMLTDVGVMLGVTKNRAAQILDRRVHPAAPPYMEAAGGRVWYRADVIAYAVLLGRKVTW